MDGSGPKKVITKKIGWPNALTIDFDMNRLWWADAHLDWIEYVSVSLKSNNLYQVNFCTWKMIK